MTSALGQSYGTNHQAWTALVYEWATAGGLNAPEEALLYLSRGGGWVRRQIDGEGWSLTTDEGAAPDADELDAAVESARREIEAELRACPCCGGANTSDQAWCGACRTADTEDQF